MKVACFVVGAIMLLGGSIHTVDTTIWDTLIVVAYYLVAGSLCVLPLVL